MSVFDLENEKCFEINTSFFNPNSMINQTIVIAVVIVIVIAVVIVIVIVIL